jgi:hypothetical protein
MVELLLRLSNSKVVCVGRGVGREDAPGKWFRVFFGCMSMENPEAASTRVLRKEGLQVLDIHCFDFFEIVYSRLFI